MNTCTIFNRQKFLASLTFLPQKLASGALYDISQKICNFLDCCDTFAKQLPLNVSARTVRLLSSTDPILIVFAFPKNCLYPRLPHQFFCRRKPQCREKSQNIWKDIDLLLICDIIQFFLFGLNNCSMFS